MTKRNYTSQVRTYIEKHSGLFELGAERTEELIEILRKNPPRSKDDVLSWEYRVNLEVVLSNTQNAE